jgi:hypothetical protein
MGVPKTTPVNAKKNANWRSKKHTGEQQKKKRITTELQHPKFPTLFFRKLRKSML